MKQDLEQLDLVGLYQLILAILVCICSFVPLVYVVIGLLALNVRIEGIGSTAPQGFGWLFVILGLLTFIISMALGILMIVASIKIKKHQSRVFCMVVAVIECILIPLGTALGIFTIGLLTNESIIQIFDGKTSPQISDQPDPDVSS